MEINLEGGQGIEVLTRQLHGMSRSTPDLLRNEARKEIDFFVNEVKRGAPVDTGEYRDSIKSKSTLTWGGGWGGKAEASFVAYTDHPAARRLELGFVGKDSRGRHYNQAPRPHWRPAIELTKGRFFQEVRKGLVRQWFGLRRRNR